MLNNLKNRWNGFSSRKQALVVAMLLATFGFSLEAIGWLIERDFDFVEFWRSLSPELIGAVVSYVVLERLISSKVKEEENEQVRQTRKKELIQRIRFYSVDRDTENIRDLVGELASFNCLKSSELRSEDLEGICLSGIRLNDVDFRELSLTGVDFRKAWLVRTDFRGASLKNADLESACMFGANLKGADLTGANLLDALIFIDRENSSGSDREMGDILIDETTILPDGEHHTASTDLLRFTTRNHPRFFREPDDDKSPASRKKWVERLNRP